MSHTLLVSTRKGLFIYERAASGWNVAQTAFLGDPVTAALLDRRDNTFYAALNLGHFGVKLRRSKDNGKTWEEIVAPVYPEGAGTVKKYNGPDMPASLELIWILEPADPAAKGTLWAGTIPGGLFRSDDAGASWALNRPLWDRDERKEWMGGGYDHAGIHSICVHPRDAKRVVVGVSIGGVWETRDGGETWASRAKGMRAEYMPPEQAFNENAQDPHRCVQSPTNSDVLYAQHHNGIFRSENGLASWDEVSPNAKPSAFGFAVAVHPKDANTAWFVPAIKDEKRIPVDGKLVVSRTRDGGKTFEVLSKGLPQENCYDLIYRHGLDVDAEGKTLAMGSTTGSLFISEDGGESWTLVSAHLPPVYAVRWG